VVAFVITAAPWWLYFDELGEHSRRNIAESEDPGRLARDAYTYLPLRIVAGIIMVAVADALVLADRLGPRAPAAEDAALRLDQRQSDRQNGRSG
jgi:low temperature requirement protein LtrA